MEFELRIVLTHAKAKSAILSRLIMWVSHTNYSHVAFMWAHPRMPFHFTYESKLDGGVNYTDEMDFLEHNQIVKIYGVNWSEREKDQFTFQCSKHCRKVYGLMGVVGLGFVYFFKWIGGSIRNPFPIGEFCSQAAIAILKNTFGFEPNEPLENIGPKELDEILGGFARSNPKRVKLLFVAN